MNVGNAGMGKPLKARKANRVSNMSHCVVLYYVVYVKTLRYMN